MTSRARAQCNTWLNPENPQQLTTALCCAAAMLAARILRAANKIADKVAPSRAVTMHAVPNGVPPTPQPQQAPPPQRQAGGIGHAAAGVSMMG